MVRRTMPTSIKHGSLRNLHKSHGVRLALTLIQPSLPSPKYRWIDAGSGLIAAELDLDREGHNGYHNRAALGPRGF